jgi:hypothetical protein
MSFLMEKTYTSIVHLLQYHPALCHLKHFTWESMFNKCSQSVLSSEKKKKKENSHKYDVVFQINKK